MNSLTQTRADYTDPACTRRVDFAAPRAAEEIVRALDTWGFAVVAMPHDTPADRALKEMAAALGLGEPCVPALYRHDATKRYNTAYSDITDNSADQHPGFSRTTGQDWHVDGLLDDIGVIKTTVLHCVRAAHSGGETLLFNSLAAYEALHAADPEAAEALMSPQALTRRSTIPGVDLRATGPVFSYDGNGDLITRYTDNDTCEWDESAGPSGPLRRGLAFLTAQARDPRQRLAVLLAAGESLIFRNDRLSHGRLAYEDAPHARRHLVRALFTRVPTAEPRGGTGAASSAARIREVTARFAQAGTSAEEAVNLVPSENRLSPLARLPLRSDFYNRYFFNDRLDPDFWQFRGGEQAAELETELAVNNLAHLAGAEHVNVRPISGMSAMMIAMAGLAGTPGGTVVSVDAASGGHYATVDVARRLGFRSRTVPVVRSQTDEDALAQVLRDEQPQLVYLDFQNCRYELDVAGVARLVAEHSPGTLLHVDCSHTLGLILGGAMSNPLDHGADSVGGSTHKTFPGPHKGVLATRSAELRDRLRETQFTMLSSHHFAETMALGLAAAEFTHFGAGYARQVLANAKLFGERLLAEGFDVVTDDDGHITATHQVWVRIGDAARTSAFSQRLFDQGIRVNVQVDLPGVPGPALRLGVNELTFAGGGPEAISVLVEEFAAARTGLGSDGKGARRVREACGAPYHFTDLV